MASPAELPDLVREFTDMSKEYLLQETVEPAKNLGRHAGYSLGAAAAFSLGVLLLSTAIMRLIRDELLPSGLGWSALGYLIGVVLLLLLMAIMVAWTGRDSDTDTEADVNAEAG